MEDRIVKLEKLIEVEKRRTWAYDLYKQADPDSTVSYKSIVIINIFILGSIGLQAIRLKAFQLCKVRFGRKNQKIPFLLLN
jgi:hypothetical protein